MHHLRQVILQLGPRPTGPRDFGEFLLQVQQGFGAVHPDADAFGGGEEVEPLGLDGEDASALGELGFVDAANHGFVAFRLHFSPESRVIAVQNEQVELTQCRAPATRRTFWPVADS